MKYAALPKVLQAFLPALYAFNFFILPITGMKFSRDLKDKIIVLIGALVPYRFSRSDGQFNLGSALAFLQELPPGIYIAMNGRCFLWNKVYKYRQTGEFCELAEVVSI